MEPITASLAGEQDVLRLADSIKDDWTLAMFMAAHKRAKEAEVMIAQTIHACRINHGNGQGLFSFKGSGLNTFSGCGLVDNPTAYATLLRLEYFVEDTHKDCDIIRPTQFLVDSAGVRWDFTINGEEVHVIDLGSGEVLETKPIEVMSVIEALF